MVFLIVFMKVFFNSFKLYKSLNNKTYRLKIINKIIFEIIIKKNII